ncbi:hypothetical protein MUK42_20614 [Musa troglodytarum]|uniref:Uncharacterized protein n=1 Tax=Musa troglodytarum TaxID=320322 RepID=A0A9E7K4R6_9LILI|nr:hypothetical protein MUK42_20614 [Musa troglodytarum]
MGKGNTSSATERSIREGAAASPAPHLAGTPHHRNAPLPRVAPPRLHIAWLQFLPSCPSSGTNATYLAGSRSFSINLLNGQVAWVGFG